MKLHLGDEVLLLTPLEEKVTKKLYESTSEVGEVPSQTPSGRKVN